MDAANSFAHRVRPLLEAIDLISAIGDAEDMFSLAVDDQIRVGLLGTQNGMITIVAEIGVTLGAIDNEQLILLLAQDAFQIEHPPLLWWRESADGSIVLWTREHWDQLDDCGLIALFERVVAASLWTRNHIARATSATASALVSMNHFTDPKDHPCTPIQTTRGRL
jgi:hypothetical protein